MMLRPIAVDVVEEAMLMLTSAELVTVMLTLLDVTPADEAETVVLPAATPVAMPVVLLMVAMLPLLDVHCTRLLMSAVVPSE